MTGIEGDYLTIKEASEVTGVSVARLQQLVRGYWSFHAKTKERTWHESVVPSKRVGRMYLIHRDDLVHVINRPKPGWRVAERYLKGES